jgi:hypothetical protein
MSRYDEIRKEAQTMQEYLEINVGGEDINEYLVRLDTLGVFYARSGALQAEVIGLLNSSIAKLYEDDKSRSLMTSLPASLVQKYIKGATAEWEALEKWLDRINASCNKQCDNLRTLISYEKQRSQII